MRWRTSGFLGAATVALAVAGCGGSGGTEAKSKPGSARSLARSSAAAAQSSSASSGRPMVVPISYDGTTCAPGWSALKPGSYEFVLQNRANDVIALTLLNSADGTTVTPTTPVTPGARASIHATLRPGGSYEWRCQTPSQAAATSVAIQVGGHGDSSGLGPQAPISTAQLYQPLARYTRYVSGKLARLRAQLGTLQQELQAGDGAGAESAWLAAHLTWLEIGQDDGAYGAFGTLGNQIDGLADGDVGGTSSRQFTGFHRVEFDLWRRHDLPAASGDTTTLVKLVGSINARTLSQDLPATTISLNSWALRVHEILEDALRDTLSGNDDYGSDSGLASVGADVTATREMLRVLGGLIEPRAPGLVQTATRQLDAIDSAIGTRRALRVTALPHRTRLHIDATVDSALSTLAPVSELIQITAVNS